MRITETDGLNLRSSESLIAHTISGNCGEIISVSQKVEFKQLNKLSSLP